MPFHLDVDRAIRQRCHWKLTHTLSSLDGGTKHWPEDLGSIPIYRQLQPNGVHTFIIQNEGPAQEQRLDGSR
jgi:hypothetical protein